MVSRIHEPTDDLRRQVRALAGMGVPHREIAPFIGISPPTLRKYYEAELHAGKWEANAKVAQSLFRKATGDGNGSVTAAIFWLKAQAGWKEASVHEISQASDGITIKFASTEDKAEE